MEYGSRAMTIAGLTTGLVGTGLGVINGAGGIANLLGGGQRQPADPGDRNVTRYEMGLWQEINAEKLKVATLEAKGYTDAAVAGVQAAIGQQMVWNATQQGIIDCIRGQVAQLQGMTKTVIPNGNVSPGWGPIIVEPQPAAAAASGT